ncbi:uncharacterized protein JCM10292_001131 [Rhodotorula paludigena]|uniref:uncharacterized protein n=1 Tax=Rhodotorula paludigena TaxID=86838 RepID=UPI003178955B
MSSPQREGPFKRLVRSLSRSSPRSERPAHPPRRTSSRGKRLDDIHKYAPKDDAQRTPPLPSPHQAYSTSPPPDSYFPIPPMEVLQDSEASGASRHPESVGARAFDVGGGTRDGQAAPGVSFAPTTADYKPRPDSELDGWRPAPRRTPSQRVRRQPSSGTNGVSNGAGGANLSRGRSSDRKAPEEPVPPMPPSPPLHNGFAEKVQIGDRTLDAGDRRGVTLEDTPLSRTTSVKRAASSFRRRAQKAFEPPAKSDGEKRVLLLVADGSEEIETLTAFDVFVRASLSPTVVSVSPQFSPSHSLPHLTLSRGAKLLADTQFETLKPEHKDDFDAVVVPGGAKGAERLSQDPEVQDLLRSFYFDQDKLVATICAGSLAAKTAGIGVGGRITSHPSVRGELEKHYAYSEDRVVVDGNLVSSRGPGTALEWALQIVEILAGKAKRDEVAGPMML